MATKFISPQDPTVDIFQGRPAVQRGHQTGILLPGINLTHESGLFSFKIESDCRCDNDGENIGTVTCSVDYYHPRSISEVEIDHWIKTGRFMREEDD